MPGELRREEQVVGRLTSAAWSARAGGWMGLGVVRRDVEDGAVLGVAGGGDATVRPERGLRAP